MINKIKINKIGSLHVILSKNQSKFANYQCLFKQSQKDQNVSNPPSPHVKKIKNGLSAPPHL